MLLLPENPKSEDYNPLTQLTLLTSKKGKTTLSVNIFNDTNDNLNALAKASGVRVVDVVRDAINRTLLAQIKTK